MKFAFAFAALLLAGSAVAGPTLPEGKQCSPAPTRAAGCAPPTSPPRAARA
ncbi:MAG: hypothetical protein R3F60_27725 [bacterium]